MRNIGFVVLFLSCITLFGQEYTVTGQITDGYDLPIANASVTLDGLDNNRFKQSFTNGEGIFEFKIPKGKYDLIIQLANGTIVEREEVIAQDRNLGVIKMDSAIQLSETVAVGEKPLYRLELDKRVYDMDRDPSVKGSNLSDALNNVPSVVVDSDGTISLRGSENITVLIDGKQSSMTGISSIADALKNIQADAVQRVEVITNPSARYDASGTGGIINIIMKKGTNLGFNASFNANVGYPLRSGLNANMNFKNKKWNFFLSPYISYSEPEGSSEFINRFYNDNGPDTIEKQNGERVRERFNIGSTIGFEHYIDDKNTLTTSISFRKSTGDNTNTLKYTDYYGEELTGKSMRQEVEDETDNDVQGNIGYKHEFNNQGHELNIDASASYAKEDEYADIVESTQFGIGENTMDKTTSEEQQRRYVLRADYVYPHGESARFEAGYKSQLETNITDFSVANLENGEFVVNPNYTDRVDYDQNVHALYTQYGNKHGKFSYLLGLRMEISDINIQSASANSDDSKEYTDWFPSATLNYTIDEKEENQVQVSYSRRIRRPWSRWLSPFRSYSDDRNTFVGNPDLDPVYTDAYELAYITQIGKTSITPSIYYRKSENDMTVYRSYDEANNVFVARPINAGDEVRYGAELVASTQPSSWWRLYGNLSLFGYDISGAYVDPFLGTSQDLSNDGFSWFGRLSNNFTLPKEINLQLNGFYFGGQNTAQSERDPIWGVDLALSKDILKGNGTLTFNVRDMFNTRRRKVHNFGEGYESNLDMQWRARQFTLNFAYRINQKKKRERGERDGDGGNEGMEF